MSINSITIRQPDDWHLHLRDGPVLDSVVPHSARQFARAIIMPNLQPPVTNVHMALSYRDRIMESVRRSVGANSNFNPLMTLYLTDNTSAHDIKSAHQSGMVYAVKLYPAGATTNSDAGVTDLMGRCTSALEELQKLGMPLLVHGEVTDPDVDVFDREAVFIERVMEPLRKNFPELKVVFEHLTTSEGVSFVLQDSGPTAATITAHHLLYNRNELFKGGIRPHYYCLPVLKREVHRKALLEAATSGHERFFLGTDSAPHVKGAKETDCGCAGCYTALHALELYATAFDSVGKLHNLEAFASINGPNFYGLPVNDTFITLNRTEQRIPDSLPMADSTVVPLDAGQTLSWTLLSDSIE